MVLFIFLGLTGFVLDQAFQRTAEQSVAEKLRIQIYGLLSVTEVDLGQILLPEALQEPRFNNPGSGLFAMVRDGEGRELEHLCVARAVQVLAVRPGGCGGCGGRSCSQSNLGTVRKRCSACSARRAAALELCK